MNKNLNVTDFKVVYATATQRIFNVKVNNTADFTLFNLSWSLNTGNGIKLSEISFELKPTEEIFIYIYHNYSATGNYNVTATIIKDVFTEIESINVTV